MSQTSNNIHALPDFLAMQRMSFCWFITQGLTEELALVPKIHDFSQNAEYVLFSDEYTLIKPSYTLTIARKYSGNYRAQLVIPVELRNKLVNEIHFQNQFPIITLPLMTTYATFIINGCERVIVSQIIRSPGVYFEKSKNQKTLHQFKPKLSNDIHKLRTFLPSGEVAFSEFNLFFASPTLKLRYKEEYDTEGKKIAYVDDLYRNYGPEWEHMSVIPYFLDRIQQSKYKLSAQLLECLKFYNLIARNEKSTLKTKWVLLFVEWLKQVKGLKSTFTNTDILFLIEYFQHSISKLKLYKLLNRLVNQSISLKNKSELWNDSAGFRLTRLTQRILDSQLTIQFSLEERVFFVKNFDNKWFLEKEDLQSLKQKIEVQSSKTIIKQFFFTERQPFIYRPTSLKGQKRYKLTNKKKKEKFARSTFFDNALQNPNTHKYLSSKSRYLLYYKDHEVITNYQQKYNEKESYTATLIPDYGSWIRFNFQKNTKLTAYKFPIKNQEEELLIQVDKITSKPFLLFLKEMGLTDSEIYQNLSCADFFYFTEPLLMDSPNLVEPIPRFEATSEDFKNISEFSRIFDPKYYRLGRVGRLRMNSRLNIEINHRLQIITYEDIFAIVNKLISSTIAKTISDDIDHLKNKRVRSVGELLQNLFRIGFQRLVRKSRNQTYNVEADYLLSFSIVNATLREFFGSSQLSQYLDQTNPLSSLTHRRRISGLGPGGLDRDRISFSVRDIHPSHYGRICPIETPEGQNVGLISSLTTCARVNKLGFLETPFWRVINGKVIRTGNPIYLSAEIEDLYKIAPADIAITEDNYLMKNLIPVRYKQDFFSVTPSEVDFISISTIQVVSVAASLIPFFEHDDANRALMGSNMQRQSVPLIFPQKPIVGTGLESQIAIDSGMAISTHISGVVDSVTANKIVIQDKNDKKTSYKLQKYLRSNQQTCINQHPIVWKGEKIKSGQILTDGPAIATNELALGQNVLVAYMPWQGYNFEDAILISERLIYDDIFSSIHIERYKVDINRNLEMSEQTTKVIPNLTPAELKHLNDDGIVKVGTFIKPGDILVGKVISNNTVDPIPEAKLLRAIFGAQPKGVKDNSYRMSKGGSGRVIETVTFNRKTSLTYTFEKIYIFVAQIRKIQVGDKIAGRHGNKGIISRILARYDMPFLPDGTPVDIILNPLGVPSRMNVGQLYECLLGLAGDRLNCRFKILPFDEMYGLEMSRILINKKLRQASIQKNESWLFNPYAPGKMVLIDGRTGKEFENPITVGTAYMLKLIHLVDDKMHSRATGPYSLITQQPLRGKAQRGGQRFGEMEVWALEGFGAAFTLKEMLTVKSDDMDGRNDSLTAIVKGQQLPPFGIPESFKVLIQELRSIGLDISTYKIDKFSLAKHYESEVNIIENYNPASKTFSPDSDISNITF